MLIVFPLPNIFIDKTKRQVFVLEKCSKIYVGLHNLDFPGSKIENKNVGKHHVVIQ